MDCIVSISSSEAGHRQETLSAEHCEIITAPQERDGRRAGRIFTRHAGRARERVLSARSPIVP
jgi:DNA-binding GntR family transcriptional regulator